MSHLSATTDSYTIPAAEVTRLNGFSSLFWHVRIRESDPYVTNPDGSVRSYNIYSNNGPSQPLTLPNSDSWQPVASFTANPNPAACGQFVTFDGSEGSSQRILTGAL